MGDEAPLVLIELFGGLLSGAFAFQFLGWPVAAHYYSETEPDALYLAAINFPDAVNLGDIRKISDAVLTQMANKFPAALFVLAGGPPCTDVSLLNATRVGADGPASGLRGEFARIYQALLAAAPGRVRGLMECTRMDAADRCSYDEVFGAAPFEVCARSSPIYSSIIETCFKTNGVNGVSPYKALRPSFAAPMVVALSATSVAPRCSYDWVGRLRWRGRGRPRRGHDSLECGPRAWLGACSLQLACSPASVYSDC